jgi:mannonate dehydratase
MSEKMRVALGQFDRATDDMLRFAKQLGVSGVLLNTPVLPGDKRWEYMDLVQLRATVEDYGLTLEALENVPLQFYDKAMLGLPERDEQIENYQETIRNVGRAGIPILGYHWMPNSVWRTSTTTLGRGGAHVTSFDLGLVQNAPLTHGRVYGDDEMWQNYAYFLKAVLPVAEEFGVKLALHPDDPPVESLGGIARLFRGFEGFRRGVLEIAPSPNHGLDFCMGCWSEMGKGVIEPIEYFGSRGKIFYVHFRDVQGVVPKFQECFIGEGNVSTVEAMRALKRVGFTGFFIDDHVPHMVDDSDFGHRGRAHATGYILGLLAAIDALG